MCTNEVRRVNSQGRREIDRTSLNLSLHMSIRSHDQQLHRTLSAPCPSDRGSPDPGDLAWKRSRVGRAAHIDCASSIQSNVEVHCADLKSPVSVPFLRAHRAFVATNRITPDELARHRVLLRVSVLTQPPFHGC
jgi:hypothetical protein